MENHLKNLAVLSGNDEITRYEYILSQNQLYKAYFNSRRDLRYALRKEVKRDRYIENIEGLEKNLQKEIMNIIMQGSDAIADMVTSDMVNSINSAIGGGASVKNSTFEVNMGKALGKAFGELPFVLLDEVVNGKEEKR